jgi:hypothetical protein
MAMIKKSILLLVLLTGTFLLLRAQSLEFSPSIFFVLDSTKSKDFECCSRQDPQNITEYWKVNQEDILLLEQNFKKIYDLASKGCCQESVKLTDLKYHAFQYQGLTIGSKRCIYLNAFPINLIERYKKQAIHFSFIKNVVDVCDGGSAFWGALFELDTKKFIFLAINGLG